MGVSCRGVDVKTLKQALNTLCYMTGGEELHKNIDHLPVVVRSRHAVDTHFYLDIKNDKVIITPNSYYKKKGK